MPLLNYRFYLCNQLFLVRHIENISGSKDIVAESAERIFCSN